MIIPIAQADFQVKSACIRGKHDRSIATVFPMFFDFLKIEYTIREISISLHSCRSMFSIWEFYWSNTGFRDKNQNLKIFYLYLHVKIKPR